MTTRPATPLPWSLTTKPHSGGVQLEIEAAPGNILKNRLIAVAWPQNGADEKDAAYLLHAANSYPRLVEALRACVGAASKDAVEDFGAVSNAADIALALLRELGEIE
jgi:hypothetical protein